MFRANIAVVKINWILTLIDSYSTEVQSFSRSYAGLDILDEDKVYEGYVKLFCFETSWQRIEFIALTTLHLYNIQKNNVGMMRRVGKAFI